ncbi:MAG: DUF4375 domain-containing protein [Bacteroidota bacterium]
MDESEEQFNKKPNKLVDDFMNRPIYKNLTVEIINNLHDEDLTLAVMDTIWVKMDKNLSNEFEIVSSLPEGRKAIYSTYVVESEVNNGGFNQFYFNSSSQFAEIAVEGFAHIGVLELAELMRKANATYIHEYDKITEEQDGTLEGFSRSYEDNPLGKYDDEFYKLDEADSLNTLQVKFIRENKEEFIDL